MDLIVILLVLSLAALPLFFVRLRRTPALKGSNSETSAPTRKTGEGEIRDDRDNSALTFLAGAGAIVIAVALLLMVAMLFYAIFRWPTLARFRDAEELMTLLANLAVTCCAFPAYLRTKRRAFLAVGFAALIFAYGTIFSMILTSHSTARWRTTHSQAQWYFASRHITNIIALLLYSYGFISLAKSDQRALTDFQNETPKSGRVGLDEPT